MINPVLKRYDMGQEVLAFSTTRHGGVGQGAYGTFNINTFCGDDVVNTTANKVALARQIGIPADHIIMPHQVHGIDSRVIGPDFFKQDEAARYRILDGIDAVMTQMRGVCIGVSTADCVPVLIYDNLNHAVCAVHSGWRGTVKRIASHALRDMKTAFGTDTSRVKAVIGPCISLKNFEVGDEVYDQFAHEGFEMSRISVHYDKWHIDLPACVKAQLMREGVPADNIKLTSICTYDNVDDFFSARRLGVNSGRIFNGIMLR